MKKKGRDARTKRKVRIRKKIHGDQERPRMSVFRSNKHIYVQVVDDTTGRTLLSASSASKEYKAGEKGGANIETAKKVGAAIAEQAREKSIEKVIFDRNGYLYHGRIKALADAAREKGLKF